MYFTNKELIQKISIPTNKHFFVFSQALYNKYVTIEEIYDITNIDLNFLFRLYNIM